MTFNEAADAYNAGYEAGKFDYDTIVTMVVQALQDEHGMSLERAQYVYGYAYQEKHSCFIDVIWFADELGDFLKKLPA